MAAERTAARGGAKRDGRCGGSALVLALLVVVVLSTLVMSLSFEARLEMQFARYLRDRAAATRLAESGVEVAKMLMERAAGRGPAMDVEDDEDRWHDAAERLKKGQALVGLVEPVGDGFVVLDIEPEPGRLNVNLLSRDDWETVVGPDGSLLPDMAARGVSLHSGPALETTYLAFNMDDPVVG
ncbi:MAG: general secretion pathway protein GspK, partial [Kiritimatiellae bacterium]|nr:general secretion pathway protein GspK [Kiritimatiellia bacterium]